MKYEFSIKFSINNRYYFFNTLRLSLFIIGKIHLERRVRN